MAVHYICGMFIREVKKQRSKSSGTFYQYNLVQAARVDGKVKQTVILYLGSDPLLKDKANRDLVLAILKSKIFGQQDVFPEQPPKPLLDLALSFYEKYAIRYPEGQTPKVSIPPAPQKAEYHHVDIKGLGTSDVKSFGAEHLCTQVLEKLGLRECFGTLGMDSGQARLALIAIAARAIFSSSEHKTARILELNSELPQCYKYEEPISHKQLYAISDILYGHKEQIDRFLYRRITNMFDIEDRLVIFDISNTYFESRKAGSTIAKHGRSKEKRGDCPVVVFTGVINAQGFIRHSRVYEGNKADTHTLSDMLADLKKHAGPSAKHTIVMDAGIATEDNLALIQEKGYQYVCVSRKRLKDYPANGDSKKTIQLTDREKNKVELAIFSPEGHTDTWMYVQSEAKRLKEQSMDTKLRAHFEEGLATIQKALGKKGGVKKTERVWERIGRAKQRSRRVSGRYLITVGEKDGKATAMEWTEKPSPVQENKTNGVYFIRTNYKYPGEKELWDIYNTIREVEATFRCLKSDLNIRPVHHQKDERIEAHIYLTLLAYQLVNTIRHMLKNAGINDGWANIVRIMGTQTIQTIEIPTDKKCIHLRKPSKPIMEAQQIYKAAQCKDTQKAVKKYVVYH